MLTYIHTSKKETDVHPLSFHLIVAFLLKRLQPRDLPYHVGRIYLRGTNTPLAGMGGAWFLPPSPPTALLPMINPAQYAQFARDLNRLLAWGTTSSHTNYYYYYPEVFVYVCLSWLCPPLGSFYLMGRRKFRRERFYNYVLTYDHSFFLSSKCRMLMNSLRCSVTSDLAVGFIDIVLYDEAPSSPYLPLLEIGQPRLPLVLRLTGLGTYLSPYYLDSMDVLTQCVLQCTSLSRFIADRWIEAIAVFNKKLSMLRRDYLDLDLLPILEFLSEMNSDTVSLGGVMVDLCLLYDEGGRGASAYTRFDTSEYISLDSTGEGEGLVMIYRKERGGVCSYMGGVRRKMSGLGLLVHRKGEERSESFEHQREEGEREALRGGSKDMSSKDVGEAAAVKLQKFVELLKNVDEGIEPPVETPPGCR